MARVKITFKAAVGSATLQVTPGRFQISKSKNEQVEWTCDQSGFTVDFGTDTPFNFSVFSRSTPGSVSSGPINTDVNPPGNSHIYKYKVTVGGSVLDPEGQVDP